MASRFVATELDLSRFTGFSLVDVFYETIRDERLTSLVQRFVAAGIPFDVDMLATDPSVILQEEDAYREMLDLAAINDAARSLTLAFASGDALDQIGNTYFATARLVIDASDPENIVLESDARYRRRIQLAPEAFSGGGTPGGYLYHALTSDPRVKDANVFVEEQGTGQVFVAIMSSAGDGTVTGDLLEVATKHLMRDDVKLATDWLTVEAADVTTFAVNATLIIPPGVQPSIAVTEATQRLNSEAAFRHRVNMQFPRSAIMAALHAGNVIRVDLAEPAMDIDPGVRGVAFLTGATIGTAVYE